MAGGLLDLVAVGAQDVPLTSNPHITYWRNTFKRYTNFAIEPIEQTFNGQADFGRRVQCTLTRSGDLAYRSYLQVTLPEINQRMGATGQDTDTVYARWLDFPGEQLIAQVDVEIGGQRIDRHYGDWMHIWNQLTMTAEQQRAYFKMVGNTTQLTFITDPDFSDVDGPCDSDAPRQVCAPRNALPETTLYVPLQFWFCTNPGLALPLIALQFHEVRLSFDFRPLDECLWAVTTLNCFDTTTETEGDYVGGPKLVLGSSRDGQPVPASIAYNQSMVAASVYVDYVFLDTDERRKVSQSAHTYLISQLQFTGDESVGSSSNRIKVNLNHPTEEIVWVVQPDQNVDYCSSLVCGSALFKVLGAQPFNYTDALDALPNAIHSFGSAAGIAGTGAFIDEHGMFNDAGAVGLAGGTNSGYWHGTNNQYGAPNFGGPELVDGVLDVAGDYHNTNSGVSDAGTFVLAECSLDMHCWGQNPVVTAKLQLNGQDRTSEREGSYFDTVVPKEAHTRAPDTGINVMSFALRPEETQPSGSLNFSRIDNATLQLVLSNATVESTKTAKVRVYGRNHNFLKIVSGMGGITYSS